MVNLDAPKQYRQHSPRLSYFLWLQDLARDAATLYSLMAQYPELEPHAMDADLQLVGELHYLDR